MEIIKIVYLIIASLMVLTWIKLATKYEEEYRDLTDSIDESEYKYSELYCIGFALMNKLHIDSKSQKSRKRIKEISEVLGNRYAEYYFYVMNGEKYTFGFTLMTIFAVMSALAGTGMLLLIGIVASVLIMWYIDETLNDKLTERRDQLLADFPLMLSKMTLLVNSGMVVRDAWRKLAYDGNRELNKEMQMTVGEMQNGVSEIEAYRNFAERCSIKEIKRFSSSMIQNMQKGNSEMAYLLKEMSSEMWEEKKHLVKRKGEVATSKLMFPSALIFTGILILIIVPIFMNM